MTAPYRRHSTRLRKSLYTLPRTAITSFIILGLTALSSVVLSGPAWAMGNSVQAALSDTPWYVNDYPNMPAPFRGPLKIDVSRKSAQRVSAENPTENPPGSNDWNCTPSRHHPYPVILVHGTSDLPSQAWNAGAPLFKNAGYCVFALSYGMLPGETGEALDSIEHSAQQLADYVQKVLRATGAKKVNIVGHSQGGMMPFYYMNFLNGYKYVKNYAGISPSLRGTDGFGLLNSDPLYRIASTPGVVKYPSQVDQMKNSALLQKLHSRPLTHRSVNYTVITTRYDDVVTPYTSQLLPSAPNTTNIVVQDLCPTNYTDHYANVFDPESLNAALQAFDPIYQETVPCGISLPVTGGYIPPQETSMTHLTALSTNKAILPAPFRGPHPVVLSKLASQQAGLADKNAVPAGANYFDPHMALHHPYPVLLVHGTFDNASSAWIGLAPLLRNAGFNVFTFNYGRPHPDAKAGGQTDLRNSAKELARMVDHVLSITGATKVDLVGHSQGGLLPHWYISRLNGAHNVHRLIGLGADNRGTWSAPAASLLGLDDTTASKQQTPSSTFMKEFTRQNFLSPQVHYTMIGSIFDTTVLPLSSKWLPEQPNVTNIVIQKKYPTDFTDHFAMPYDPYTLAEVVHTLDPSVAWTMPLGIVPPYLGGFLAIPRGIN